MLEWLESSKLKDVYATTGLLHKYLNFLYQNYIKKCSGKNWIREGDFDKEFCDTYYPNLTLKKILHNQDMIPANQPGTLIFQGDKGDGRKFFFKKLIECCVEKIPPHITWENVKSENASFCLPIIVTLNDVNEWSNSSAKDSPEKAIYKLIGICIEEQLYLQNAFEKKMVQNFVQELINQKKIVLFFEPEIYKSNPKINDILVYLSQIENGIFTILIEDRELEISDSKYQHCIEMQPLNETQIANYLSAELGNDTVWHNKLNADKELVRILNKPERLLMYVKSVGQMKTKDMQKHAIHQKLYYSFINTEIKKASEQSKKYGKATASFEKLFDWLKKYAVEGKVFDDEHFFDFFKPTDMFNNKDRSFKFEGCKHYLIASSFYQNNMKPEEIEKTIKLILKIENPIEVLCFFACFFKNSKVTRFNTFYNHLVKALSSSEFLKSNLSDVQIIIEVLIISDTFLVKKDEFFKWIIEKLNLKAHNISVFKSLEKIANIYGSDFVSNMLMLYYDNNCLEDAKRRIVHYFSYSKRGFPKKLFDDLCNEDTKLPRHLKYHIISALRDNYNYLDNSLIKSLSKLEDYLDDDCIMRSEYEILYSLANPSNNWLSGKEQKDCVNNLISKLVDGEYWERAHAAGALSRRSYCRETDVIYAIEKMCNVIESELEMIPNAPNIEGNILRSISYIVESLCRLSNERSEIRKDVFDKLINLTEKYIKLLLDLEIPVESYCMYNVALALILTGIHCLINEKFYIREALENCLNTDEPLISLQDTLYEINVIGYEKQCNSIDESLVALTELIKEESIKRHLKIDSNKKSDFSLVRIQCLNGQPFYGFLFGHNHNVFCSTCRHNVFQDNNFLDLSKIAVFTTFQKPREYTGKLMYPDDISSNTSFDDSAHNDLAIFRISKIPVGLYKLIFSINSIDTELCQGKALRSFCFPSEDKGFGEWFHGNFRESASHGFFSFFISDEEKTIDSQGFSGVPIINDEDKLCGMWKGSKTNSNKIGIYFGTILEHIENINKGW